MLPPVLGEARLLRSIGAKEGEAMHSWKEFDLTPKGIEIPPLSSGHYSDCERQGFPIGM